MSAQKNLPILNNLHVAKPCPASWKEMTGTDQQRHCTHCSRTVYNLSAMDPAAITALFEQQNNQLCARFFRRRDGTIMTADCPNPTTPLRWPIIAALTSFLGWFLLPTCTHTMGKIIPPSPATQPGNPMPQPPQPPSTLP